MATLAQLVACREKLIYVIKSGNWTTKGYPLQSVAPFTNMV